VLSIFASILSLVLKPLFDLAKDLLKNKVESRKKVSRTLLRLLDHLESIGYLSAKLVKDTREYVSKDWIAWTVARNKRNKLVSTSEELKKETFAFGESLSSLYMLLDIYDPKLLSELIGLYSVKAHLFAEPIAIPEMEDVSKDPKEGHMLLTIPKSADSVKEYIEENFNNRFRQERAIPKENYLTKIEIDENREQVLELLKNSDATLTQIQELREAVRELIRSNISIDDFIS
jgi:hypothetical protein